MFLKDPQGVFTPERPDQGLKQGLCFSYFVLVSHCNFVSTGKNFV